MLAAEMKKAEEEESFKIEVSKWPPAAKDAIAALKNEIRLAISYWQKTTDADTPDKVYSNINLALKYCGGPSAGHVRTALGLPEA